MKKIKNLKKLILFLIIIILFTITFFLSNLKQVKQFDDFLFLKLFSNSDSNNQEKNRYEFKIDYKNIEFKSINLLESKNEKTLVNEKIAPGTSGSFSIILKSNKKSIYKIKFESLNEKPQNLKFKAFKDNILLAEEYTLEKLSEKLEGIIENQEIEIKINWCWDFESSENENIQDTEDAKNIEKYKFKIYAHGEKIE